MSSTKVLVTGATGKQGGAVIKALQASPKSFELLALTRNPTSPSAQKLQNQGVRLIQGDLKFPGAIFAAAGEVDTVFFVNAPSEAEERQGKMMFDAAQEAGVKHFVYSSVNRHGFNPTPVLHWASKHFIEKHIMENAKTTEWTILRPVAFMDNFAKGMQSRVLFTCFEAYLGRDQPVQHIATEDIGKFAAIMIEDPNKYKGKAISLAGDSLNVAKMQKVYEDITHLNPNPTFHCVARVLLGWMMRDMGRMFVWFQEVGYDASIEECREILPSMMDFETWAKKNLA